MTGPIRCTRVDAPAKPSREEVIHRSILQCLRSRPDEISRAVERALTAWEADNPAPTYRIELDAETFEALARLYQGTTVFLPEPLRDIVRVAWHSPAVGEPVGH